MIALLIVLQGNKAASGLALGRRCCKIQLRVLSPAGIV
jgi:hypothetical protein